MSNEYLRSRSNTANIPWLWVWIIIAIVAIIIIARSFSNGINTSIKDRPFLVITPETPSSTVFISMTESSKSRITGTGSQEFYVGDKSVSVENGWANGKNKNISLDLDEKTELAYLSSSNTGDTFKLIKWKVWLNQEISNSRIDMKNLSVIVPSGTIVMLEQTNPVFSIAYVFQWEATIATSIGEYILKAGNRIMLSATELSNPWLQLSSQVWSIDEDIMNNPLFIKNNWKKILTTMSGVMSNSGSTWSLVESWSSIEIQPLVFLEPIDWSLSLKSSIQVRWNINAKDIKRITLNDKDTVISPVNNTFTFTDFPITSEVNNIVYKVYNNDGKQITKWVITVFGSKEAIQSANKLISNNSPISSKDFRIINPTSNPFVTTDRFMKVQWAVPKDTVSHINVNDYRLQKYIPWSTSWYYFANMDNDTLRDWINLYKIEFFGTKDELLYTQLFTIIKESKNVTLSGESFR